MTRDNAVAIEWVLARSGASGNEVADEYVKAAAIGETPSEDIPEGCHEETSLSHVTTVATYARPREAAGWIFDHLRAERWYRLPSGRGLRLKHLRHAKTLAGRCLGMR